MTIVLINNGWKFKNYTNQKNKRERVHMTIEVRTSRNRVKHKKHSKKRYKSGEIVASTRINESGNFEFFDFSGKYKFRIDS